MITRLNSQSYEAFPDDIDRNDLPKQHKEEHCPQCSMLDDDAWWAIYGDAGICCCRGQSMWGKHGESKQKQAAMAK